MQKRNFDKMLENEIASFEGKRIPSLLLHACCAPCSSYVLEYVSGYFDITLYFFNPNIHPEEEYFRRLGEFEKLISHTKTSNRLELVSEKYDPEEFFKVSEGLENEKEGGKRCSECFSLRLSHSLIYAEKNGFDYFGTTLTVSPHKNAELINSIGEKLAEGKKVKWLYSDFKKKGGYLRSCELSKEYGLYRQDYCGCVFAKDN